MQTIEIVATLRKHVLLIKLDQSTSRKGRRQDRKGGISKLGFSHTFLKVYIQTLVHNQDSSPYELASVLLRGLAINMF